MSRPLYDGLMAYSKEKKPFHMPGHKFGAYGNLDTMNMTLLDATEASGLDNLYEAEGIIKEAMDQMAKFYGSIDSIFLTNGSTAGILASILAVCKPGDRLLVARNCHHSVWSGLVLAGVIPIYISPKYDGQQEIITCMDYQVVARALKQYPDVKGAIIVSPTYEGIVSDIKKISEVLHERDKILIVDEAHGAHFTIHQQFPTSSIALGADLVIHSMHKTLPTLTQSGLLHRCSERVDQQQVIDALRMVQTSSPSYLMMGLMDYIREDLSKNDAKIEEQYIKPLLETRKVLEQLRHLRIMKVDMNCDISKIIILTQAINIDGYELARRLEEEYQLVVEAALSHMIILMTTVADREEDLCGLAQALLEIDRTLHKVKDNDDTECTHISGEIVLGASPRDIHFGEKEWVEITLSEGSVLAKNIMLYPPGIPLLCLGECITEDKIHQIIKDQSKLIGIKIENNEVYLEVQKIN